MSFDFLDNPEDHWVIVDSGANCYYIAHRDLPSSCEAIAAKIACVGDLATTATLQGLFRVTGMMFDLKLNEIPFDSFGMHIPKAKVSLLSILQANWGGNSVWHNGDPVKGEHGMKLATGKYIPF